MVRFCIGLFALLSSAVYAQNAYVFNASNFVVGDGPDTAYLVVDFQSAGAWDPPSSFYWSVAFEDSIQGSSLLAMVDSVDDNLTVDFMGAFVDSISLGTEYIGKNGVNGFYWGIWSDTVGGNRWVSNSGASEWVQPNTYYGLSFTDFAPAIVPDTAVAVNDACVSATKNVVTNSFVPAADTNDVITSCDTSIRSIPFWTSYIFFAFRSFILSTTSN